MPVSFAPSLAFAFTENLRNGTSSQLTLAGEFFVGKEINSLFSRKKRRRTTICWSAFATCYSTLQMNLEISHFHIVSGRKGQLPSEEDEI
jgi:hypothetical protein